MALFAAILWQLQSSCREPHPEDGVLASCPDPYVVLEMCLLKKSTNQSQNCVKILSCPDPYVVLEMCLRQIDCEEETDVLAGVAAATTGFSPSLRSSLAAAGASEVFVFAFPLYVRCWFDSFTGLSASCSRDKFRSVATLNRTHVHSRVCVSL